MAQGAHFGPELFEFLLELRSNNTRGWFQANKDRYERYLRDPMLQFITDFGPRLKTISKHFVADNRPNGGSMFRVHRDVRFSKDKSPYKTQVAAHFRHEAGKTAHAPGFYIHLDPEEVFVGMGMWQPDNETLTKIRGAIDANPRKWVGASKGEDFLSELTVGGQSLKRPPKGFDPDHKHIKDLKRKDHVASVQFDPEDAFSPGFIDTFTEACQKGSPYVQFLTAAIGLPY